MIRLTLLMILSAGALLACAPKTMPVAVDPVTCAPFKKIRTDAADKLTRATENQIIGHNLAGEAKKCWTLP